jgi:eukaryotic-like serine/threonine-protein kinase
VNDFDMPGQVGNAGESLVDLQILEQCGVGPDAVAYRAVRPAGGDVVEVRILNDQVTSGDRWTALLKRLRLVQLAGCPCITRILAAVLDAKPPRLVMEKAGERTLPRYLDTLDGEDFVRRVALADQVATAMAAAHTVGLAHGGFSPDAVRIRHDQTVQIDFSGINARASDAGLSQVQRAATCRAPEVREGCPGDMPADVFALASVLNSVLGPADLKGAAERRNSGEAIDAALSRIAVSKPQSDAATRALAKILRDALQAEPTSRPSAREIARHLQVLRTHVHIQETALRSSDTAPVGLKPSLSLSATNVIPNPVSERLDQTTCMEVDRAASGRDGGTPTRLFCERLGRYRLLEKIGEGGMGAVYKAEDQADATIVALKVLGASVASDRQALHRFRKEARLLAEVRHPNIANLLEINEDQGIQFLVMEYVSGTDLKHVLQERKVLDERLALEIISDVARALIGAHERSIVHRDVKPANIMLAAPDERPQAPAPAGTGAGRSSDPKRRVKLLDFGLARHVDQTESLKLTQTGAFLGTPYYMSPEQCTGNGEIAPGTDVYAIGATLFEMLAGRPPFMGDDPMKVATMHCFEQVPALAKFNPAVSEGAVRIVEKCLAKRPEDRFIDAAHLLEAIELFLCGEVSEIQLHPLIPGTDLSRVYSVDFEWELEASPEKLWPYVSNTERLNCAVGVPSVEYQTVRDPQHGLRKIGNFRMAGLNITWEEHPFEWIEGRRSGVLREFTRGPFQWFMSVVELQRRPTGGTLLKHSVRIEPRGWMGRCVAAMEVGLKGHRNLDRVYRRIDATVTGKLGNERLTDPFQEAAPLTASRQRRLEQRVDELVGRGVDAEIARKLGEYLATSPAQELARIRPLALARRLDANPEHTVEACLHAAQCGLLVVHWDILCPTCRISADVKDTLRAIETHGRCEVCDLDFEIDFGNSLELIFRVHPELRDVNLKTYCIGGPEHLPHVVAQVRVAPGERIDLDLQLSEGRYVLRGPQLPYSVPVEVDAIRGSTRGQVVLAAAIDPSAATLLTAGRQVLGLRNDYQRELLIRLERTLARKDVLTAAQASSMSLFRELFPGEVLRRGQLMNVATVTLMATGLDDPAKLCNDLGDAQAFEVLQDFYRTAQDVVKRQKGAVVKQIDDRILAAFDDCESAMRAALELSVTAVSAGAGSVIAPRIGVHRGAALATTLNDRLDYFGKSVNRTFGLLDVAGPGEIVLSQQVSSDLSVNELIRSEGLLSDVVCAAPSESGDKIVQRIRPRTKGPAATEVTPS